MMIYNYLLITVSVILQQTPFSVFADESMAWPNQADLGKEDLSLLTDSMGELVNLSSVAPHRNLQEADHPVSESSLHFASSARKIAAVDGAILHSVPISTAHMYAVLRTAEQDLGNFANNSTTSYHEWSYKGWSFEVACSANETLQYSIIAAIITRILFLLPEVDQKNVTWTRVGKVERGQVAIADVTLLPVAPDTSPTDAVPIDESQKSKDITNTTALEHALAGSEVDFDLIGINGVISVKRLLDSHILDIFNDTVPSSDDLTEATLGKRQLSASLQRILHTQMDGQTSLFMTIQLKDPQSRGEPQSTARFSSFRAGLLSYALSVGLTESALNRLLEAEDARTNATNMGGSSFTYYPLGNAAVEVTVNLFDLPTTSVKRWSEADYTLSIMGMLKNIISKSHPSVGIPCVEGDLFIQTTDTEGQPLHARIGAYTITAREIQPEMIPYGL